MAKLEIGLMSCEKCEKFNKAIEIYNQFDWRECAGVICINKETDEILLDEEGLMQIIQLVNPGEAARKIRLAGQDEIRQVLQGG